MLHPRSEARRSCSGAALPRRWETPAAQPNGESVGGGEEGDIDVGELVDEPQSETAVGGTARNGDEAGERIGGSGAGVVHTDHDPVGAVQTVTVMGRRPYRCALTRLRRPRTATRRRLRVSRRPCAASATRRRVRFREALTSGRPEGSPPEDRRTGAGARSRRRPGSEGWRWRRRRG